MQRPFFSVVMQSTLRDYPNAADNRPDKLRRAIKSVHDQSFSSWELIVVADDCQQTLDIAGEYEWLRALKYTEEDREKKYWQSGARNLGAEQAKGHYILYLDNDDFYLRRYLSVLYNEITRDNLDWYLSDHLEYRRGEWRAVRCNLTSGSAGTANIIHAAGIPVRWPCQCHYGSEDWQFIKRIMALNLKHRHLDVSGYCIGHMRGKYDL